MMPDSSSKSVESQVSELKVSGHTMALEPGLYCVFSAPDGPVADPTTGLPVVRISPAPLPGLGQIEVVGLDPQGWIGADAATLVRVSRSRSNLLVTVYQASGSATEAPQIQVVRISGAVPDAVAPAPKPRVGGPAAEPERMEIVAHVYGRGDVGNHIGTWTGEPGSKRWIEGFGISAIGDVPQSDIEYQAVLGRGWLSPWSDGGQFCGSRGMSLPILGLRIRLRGASETTHAVRLSATFVDGSKVGPVEGGEACEAPSLAALEAFNVTIEPRDAKPTARRAKDAPAPASKAPGGKKPAAPIQAKPAAQARTPVAPEPAPKPAVSAAKKKPAGPTRRG